MPSDNPKDAQQRLEDMEARAVDKAKATADAAFRPSPSVLNAQSAEALLSSVDGPSLETYQNKESVYVGRSVPVGAGAKIQVPIEVTAPGSVVEYAVELKAYDLAFEIMAEREDETTVVKVRNGRVWGDVVYSTAVSVIMTLVSCISLSSLTQTTQHSTILGTRSF